MKYALICCKTGNLLCSHKPYWTSMPEKARKFNKMSTASTQVSRWFARGRDLDVIKFSTLKELDEMRQEYLIYVVTPEGFDYYDPN